MQVDKDADALSTALSKQAETEPLNLRYQLPHKRQGQRNTGLVVFLH
jgi:hypothetical protein